MILAIRFFRVKRLLSVALLLILAAVLSVSSSSASAAVCKVDSGGEGGWTFVIELRRGLTCSEAKQAVRACDRSKRDPAGWQTRRVIEEDMLFVRKRDKARFYGYSAGSTPWCLGRHWD
jgi:hypothetical protein